MRKSLLTLLASILLLSCAEDEFSVDSSSSKGYISFSTKVEEMEDVPKTRGEEGHHNPAHHHEMTGAATTMNVRFTQTNSIDKYLRINKEGVQKVQDNSPYSQEISNNSAFPLLSERAGQNTRGRRIETSADFYDSFGLISFRYLPSDTWATIGSTLTPYVYNEQVRKANHWQTTEYWPGSGRNLTFFAYAPYNAQGMTLSPSTDLGTPWMHYYVPEKAKEQSDLLVCGNEHEVGSYNNPRAITFRHVCAGVRFAIGDSIAPGTITKIQLVDVYGEGWYHFGAAAWDSVRTERTFTLDQSFKIEPGESNRMLTTGDNVFMMVPQQVPANGRILVTINDGEDHVLESFISLDNWDIGTTTTYWLSTKKVKGEIILWVTPTYDTESPTGIPPTGGDVTYEVHSYESTAYGSQTPVPWTAVYTIEGDPTEYNTVGKTVTNYTNASSSAIGIYTMTVDKQIAYSTTSRTAAMRLRPAITTRKALETDRGTANCYIITQPGKYSFPLVYGNGVMADGTINSAAYNSNSFVTHDNTKISTIGPYIYNTYTPYDAVIVWQDAPNLVTPSSVKLSSDGHRIEFDIDQANICQGNCVIAVRDISTTILWSWHIWVTDYDNLQVSTGTSKTTYSWTNSSTTAPVTAELMRLPVGYCDGDTATYDPRKITLKIKQHSIANPDSAVIIYQQLGGTRYYGPNSTTFQWGRKDPMPPSQGIGDPGNSYYAPFKETFDVTYPYTPYPSWTTVANAIQYPHVLFYTNRNNWHSTSYRDLWSVGETSLGAVNNPVIKSVYDPSPAGFCLPKGATFTGICKNNSYTTNVAEYNNIGSHNYGYYISSVGWPKNGIKPTTGTPVFFVGIGGIQAGWDDANSLFGIYANVGFGSSGWTATAQTVANSSTIGGWLWSMAPTGCYTMLPLADSGSCSLYCVAE